MKVLLYDLRLHLFPCNLRSYWTDPFGVTHMSLYGVVLMEDLTSEAKQRVDGQRLKQFLERPTEEDVDCLMLHEPPNNF